MSLQRGSRLGPYEILSPLGAGGMGEVYRARDPKLNRDVAVKILPDIFAPDPDRITRFSREAQVLAALNHPHIAAIYGFEESHGVQALVLELVEGPTLADRLRAGSIPIDEALPIARQIAEALEAAHDQAIVHRDLKPANIKLRPDGTVKILDFGLAKVLEPTVCALVDATDSPTITAPVMTRSGVLLGTAAYMSPEQARGQPVNRRADIWAFGCVLFEMLSGRRAFGGETLTDTLASVMRDPPPLAALPATTPARVRLLIARCLERDPKRRLRDIGDARLELETLDAAAAAPTSEPPPSPDRRIRVRGGQLLVAGLMLVAATAALTSWIDRMTARDTSASAPVMRLTSDAGLTTDPTLSPDGRLVVYASDRAGNDNLDLWVQQIDGGAPLRLTSDPADEYEPSFSPDGTRIAFRSERDGGGVYVMPALGGDPRLITKEGRQPRFSPDGSRIAYVTSTAPGQGGVSSGTLFVVPSDGGTAQQLVSADVGAASPVWSPDGAFMLFAAGKYRTEAWGIVRSGGAESIILPLARLQQAGVADPTPRAWLAGNRILFEAKSGDSSHVFETRLSPPSWVASAWRLDASPRPLTFGTAQDERPAVSSVASAAGLRRLAYASVSRQENVWSLALDTSQPSSGGTLTQLTRGTSSHVFPSVSADGTKVAFISHASYNDQVSLLDTKTGKTSVLSTTVSTKFQTHIRADGSQVFYGDRGTKSVYTVPASGGPPERICDKCDEWVWDWSADRRWLLVFGPLKPWVAATIVNVEAKTSRVFLERPNEDLYEFALSPDGRWVVFKAETAGRSRTYVAAFSGDEGPAEDTWIPITDGSTLDTANHWSPDGRWIYAFSNRDGFRCVWAYPVDPNTKKPAGPPVPVFHAHGARLSLRNANNVSQSLSVARDKIVFNQGEITGNIWMTEIR